MRNNCAHIILLKTDGTAAIVVDHPRGNCFIEMTHLCFFRLPLTPQQRIVTPRFKSCGT